jgi:hypothetical protein
MSDPTNPSFDIQLPGGSLAGGTIVFGDPRDQELIRAALERRGGKSSMKLSVGAEPETEGHSFSPSTSVVIQLDDDDTEGHALSIHFPTRQEADDLRRRLLLAGALTGTIALSGIGVATLNSGAISNTAPEAGAVPQAAVTQTAQEQAHSAWLERRGLDVAATQAGPMDAHEAPAFNTAAQADAAWAARLEAQAAAAQTGPMDAHEAPAFDTAAQADAAWTARLEAQAAAQQTGPMDAHEAPAFQTSQADAAWTARLESQAAAQQTGPMDVHEAPAFQTSRADAAWTERLNAQAAAAQTGPMDVHEAPAFQAPAAADDESVTGRPEGSGPLRE